MSSPAKNLDNDFKWYIIKTKTNCEFKAKTAIEQLAKDHKLSDQVKEILVPEKEVIEVVKGKKVTRPKKFYPGYVFIHIRLTNSLWHLIKTTSHVVNFVGKRGQPTEIPIQQIETISHQVSEESAHVSEKVAFSAGEHVKVIDGPFKSFNGVVEEVNQEKSRVKVSVNIFGRPTPVELDFAQVYREE